MTDDLQRELRRQLAAVADRLESLDRRHDELTSNMVRVCAVLDHAADDVRARDEIVAWIYGGPEPKLTPGAQAILVRARQEARRG